MLWLHDPFVHVSTHFFTTLLVLLILVLSYWIYILVQMNHKAKKALSWLWLYSIMLWRWDQCQYVVCVCVCVVMTSSCQCFACLEGLHLGNPRPLLCYVVSFNYRLTLWSDCGKTQCLITLSTNKERRRQWRKYLFQFKRDTGHIKYLLITLLWIRIHFMRHFLRVQCLVE